MKFFKAKKKICCVKSRILGRIGCHKFYEGLTSLEKLLLIHACKIVSDYTTDEDVVCSLHTQQFHVNKGTEVNYYNLCMHICLFIYFKYICKNKILFDIWEVLLAKL